MGLGPDPGGGSTCEPPRGPLGEGEQHVERAPWGTLCGLLIPVPQSSHLHTASGGWGDGSLPQLWGDSVRASRVWHTTGAQESSGMRLESGAGA